VAEPRSRALRVALGLAIVILALVDVQGLVQTLRSQARVRERVIRATRDALFTARPRVATLLRAGGEPAYAAAAAEAVSASLAREFEIFDPSGRRVFSYPAVAPVEHWPGPEELPGILGGKLVTIGPVRGDAPRLLTYSVFQAGDLLVVARFAAPVPEVVEDLRERRELLLGHAVSLAILVVAGVLALYPRTAEAPPPRALGAYEEAMGRLRDRGDALAQQIRESAPMVRAGELTAGMAHEVRNGLGTIVGYARLVERGAPPEAAAEAARAIRRECEALEAVVRRFVEFVKEEALRLAPFDVARTLARVAAREEQARPGAAVQVEAADAVTILGDEELLERAFENLVRNAREAAGPEGHVRVEASAVDERVRVVVSDDGPGLTPLARAGLRPFATTKPGGLGLGLPLVYKIVGLHHGEVLMGDRPPHGLAVTVMLRESGPLQEVAHEAPARPLTGPGDSKLTS
jgi:signal transduction histidine kinase